ncbi:MAG: FecR domain-containing protein [Pseudomonadota bacterium]
MPPTQFTKADRELLEARAFELLRACRRTPSPGNTAALDAFRDRSPDHAAIVERAARFLELSQQLRRPKSSVSQAILLRLDLCWTRYAESPLAATASVALLIGIAVFWVMPHVSGNAPPSIVETEPPFPVQSESFSTGWRQQREIVLDDGSTVWLGWRTELDVEMTAAQRSVTLSRGIAAFKVVSDPKRPFTVNADGVETTVTGTEFVVTHQLVEQVVVAVLEGQVKVSGPGNSEVKLDPAQIVTVKDDVMSAVSRRPLAEIGQWREGMIVFSDRPLLDALTQLEPYTSYTLDTEDIVGHPGLVSGVFFVDQADEALITILETHRLEAEQSGRSRLKLRPATPRRP